MKKTISILFVLLAFATPTLALELSEIMYNPEGADSGREWVEMYAENELNISGLRFYDNQGSHVLYLTQGSWILEPGSYTVICDDVDLFLQDYPGYSGTLLRSSFSLSNSGEEIGLINGSTIIDSVNYTNEYANGDGKSLEKIGDAWLESIVMGGTPGYYGEAPIPEFGPVFFFVTIGLGIGGLMVLRRKYS